MKEVGCYLTATMKEVRCYLTATLKEIGCCCVEATMKEVV